MRKSVKPLESLSSVALMKEVGPEGPRTPAVGKQAHRVVAVADPVEAEEGHGAGNESRLSQSLTRIKMVFWTSLNVQLR
tara:strand:+ start:118 stop:354 length:237 start_codon:yes stop_codon:yes gene_type:complete